MPHVTFVNTDGIRRQLRADEGVRLLDVAWDNDIDMEGACGGVLACSTCHVIMDRKFFTLLSALGEEESDLLDLAWGVQNISRLACQITVTDALDGLVVHLPAGTHDRR